MTATVHGGGADVHVLPRGDGAFTVVLAQTAPRADRVRRTGVGVADRRLQMR